MANQLAMDKAQAIKHSGGLGYSERTIVNMTGVSRMSIHHHLGRRSSKDTAAPTRSEVSKETKAPIGSPTVQEGRSGRGSASRCEPFHEWMLGKLEQVLTAQRIWKDLENEHGFNGQYPTVRRFLAKLQTSTAPPFRHLERAPGEEMQVGFRSGARWTRSDGTMMKTHVFRAVLSYSRMGYSEAIARLTVENLILVLENAFPRFGGVPQVAIFDNGSCAANAADWYDVELHPKIIDSCKRYHFVFVPTRTRIPDTRARCGVTTVL